MRSFVYFQIFRARKHLAARWEWTCERFLARMHPNVIDQFVLGFEWAAVSRATHPEAGVCGALRPANMLHRQMRHNFVHRAECLAARFPIAAIIIVGIAAVIVVVHVMMMMRMMAVMRMMMMHPHVLVDPHALHFLFDRGLMAHIAKEGARCGRIHRIQIQIVRMMVDGRRKARLRMGDVRMVRVVVGGRRWWRRCNGHGGRSTMMMMIRCELLIVHRRWMSGVRMPMWQRCEEHRIGSGGRCACGRGR